MAKKTRGYVKGFATMKFKGKRTKVLLVGKSRGYNAVLTGYPITKTVKIKLKKRK